MHKTKKPFVDFRAIRTQVTMEQVLDHYGVLDTFKRNGNRLSGPCPIHGGSNPTQFRVDTDKNLWNCFSELDEARHDGRRSCFSGFDPPGSGSIARLHPAVSRNLTVEARRPNQAV